MRVVAVSLFVVAALAAPASTFAQSARPRTTVELLVDRARDSVVGRRGQLRDADVAVARTLLKAAMRVDPTALDALAGLYELESIAGDPYAARTALDQLVRADPTNEAAFGHWLAEAMSRPQTRETVQARLREILTWPLPPASAALVRTRLAELALQRLDTDAARQQVAEAQRLCPDCPEPAELALQLLQMSAAPTERLAAILALLRADPTAVEPAWQAAFLLDELEFHADAQFLYEHAFRTHARRHPTQRPPIECFLRAAENALARGQRDAAAAYLGAAGDADTSDLATAIWAGELFERAGVRERAKDMRSRLDPTAAAIAAAPDGVDPERLAQAAWFYVAVDSQPDKARPLAEAALRRGPQSTIATRSLGWAQAAAGDADEARITLTKIAADDAFAAMKLAELLRKAGDEDAAKRVVNTLREPPPLGLAREMLARAGWQPPTSQPKERYPEIAAILASFDRGVFEFDRNPAKFFDTELEFETQNPEPGQPWRATFSLTSRASFPIPLGPEGLVNPVFLLSFRVDADQPKEYPALFAVNVNRWSFLAPGATIRVKRTLDVGPLRSISQRFPQQPIRVSTFPLFDPAMAPNGRWLPSPTGRELPPLSLTRRPADAGSDGIEARLAALNGDSFAARFLAMETLANLLGEAERQAAGRVTKGPPISIPTERVAGSLRAALMADSWETRVRALDAFFAAGLDERTLAAVRECATHPHWLVRLMSVRLLARQGRAFASDAQRIADSDADTLVRDMARAVLARIENGAPAATQPALPSRPASATEAGPGE
jgi:tetratricopeptide (TPR) repeat protein